MLVDPDTSFSTPRTVNLCRDIVTLTVYATVEQLYEKHEVYKSTDFLFIVILHQFLFILPLSNQLLTVNKIAQQCINELLGLIIVHLALDHLSNSISR